MSGAIVRNQGVNIQPYLDAIAGILLRCFLGGMGLLLVWFAMFVFAGDVIYPIHARWFQIPRHLCRLSDF